MSSSSMIAAGCKRTTRLAFNEVETMTCLFTELEHEVAGEMVLVEVEREQQPAPAHVGEHSRSMVLLQGLQLVQQPGAERLGPGDDVVLFQGRDRGTCRRHRERVARVGGGVQQRVLADRAVGVGGGDDGGHRNDTAAQPLADEEHVRDDAFAVAAPPASQAAETGLDFVQMSRAPWLSHSSRTACR